MRLQLQAHRRPPQLHRGPRHFLPARVRLSLPWLRPGAARLKRMSPLLLVRGVARGVAQQRALGGALGRARLGRRAMIARTTPRTGLLTRTAAANSSRGSRYARSLGLSKRHNPPYPLRFAIRGVLACQPARESSLTQTGSLRFFALCSYCSPRAAPQPSKDEIRNARRENKTKVKEEAREKRKVKVPKHVKRARAAKANGGKKK